MTSQEMAEALANYTAFKIELRTILGIPASHLAAIEARAQYYLGRELWNEALTLLGCLAALDRRNPRPRWMGALVLLRSGRLQAAATFLDDGTPTLEEATRAARDALVRGDSVTASTVLRRAMQASDPGSAAVPRPREVPRNTEHRQALPP